MLVLDDYLRESSLNQYPDFMKKMRDVRYISNETTKNFTSIKNEIDTISDNQHFDTMNEEMIERMEKIAGIKSNELESLEFRRERAKNRFNLSNAFTLRFFEEKFNEIIGTGKWSVEINQERTIITLKANAKDQHWYGEIRATVDILKPASMVFKNNPYSKDALKISEKVKHSTLIKNYRLGSWKLSEKPITSALTDIEVKGESELSINNEYIEDKTEQIKNEIHHILINDSIEITNFEAVRNGNLITLNYVVEPESELEIDNIKVYNSEKIISEMDVYVPLIEKTKLTHEFELKEG